MTSEQLAIKNVGKQASIVPCISTYCMVRLSHSFFITFSAVLLLVCDHCTLHSDSFERKSNNKKFCNLTY